DTAGMRKRGKIYESTEKYSVLRASRAIERSDIVLVILNGEEGIREQDKRIAGLAHEAGKAIVIVVNKWDAVKKDEKTMRDFELDIKDNFQYLDYAPITFVSALTSARLKTLFPLIQEVYESSIKRIQSSTLNEVLVDSVSMNPTPTDSSGRRLSIYYGTQVSVKPPTFVLFVNDTELMHFSYRRYIENQLRKAFGFKGTPIHIISRKRNYKRGVFPMKLSVIGTVSFGTSLSIVLNDNKNQVLLYSRNHDTVNDINNAHTNERYLKHIQLDENIVATTSLTDAIEHADALVLAVPVSAMRTVATDIHEHLKTLNKQVLVVHVAKGLELNSYKRVSEVLSEVFDDTTVSDICVLSGPSHAEEVAEKQPTTVSVASINVDGAKIMQDIFMTDYFRVYVNSDLIGVEIGGALKNIVALAVGALSGYGFGDNPK